MERATNPKKYPRLDEIFPGWKSKIREHEKRILAKKKAKFEKKREKYRWMADMKLNNKKLLEIAKKKGQSHNTISYILKRYFPEIKFPNQSKNRPDRKKYIKIVCNNCKKEKLFPNPVKYKNRRFCNSECFQKFRGALLGVGKLPKEERRQHRQIYLRKYHSEKMKDPVYVTKQRRRQKEWRAKRRGQLQLFQ